MNGLIDSDVLIWWLRGDPSACTVVDAQPTLRLAAISRMELVQGCRNVLELRLLKRELITRKADVLPVNEIICDLALSLLERHALADGLRFGDALIAATAMHHELPLLSGNRKHFAAIAGLQFHHFMREPQ